MGGVLPAELSARAGILADLRLRVNSGNTRRARKRARELAGDVLEVTGAHDVVAIEHGARLVTGHLHRDALRTPAMTIFRTPVRRKACPCIPRTPGALQAIVPGLLESRPRPPRRS